MGVRAVKRRSGHYGDAATPPTPTPPLLLRVRRAARTGDWKWKYESTQLQSNPADSCGWIQKLSEESLVKSTR